jgi:hypothetical protein
VRFDNEFVDELEVGYKLLCYCTAELDLADARSNRLRAVAQLTAPLAGAVT